MTKDDKCETLMKIAAPISGGALATHFGHCERFAIFDVASDGGVRRHDIAPPLHAPGVFPTWLREQGVTVVVARGMGARAQLAFADNFIEVVAGAAGEDPDLVVREFLAGRLARGANPCDPR